jgi:hypothetical protein
MQTLPIFCLDLIRQFLVLQVYFDVFPDTRRKHQSRSSTKIGFADARIRRADVNLVRAFVVRARVDHSALLRLR